MLSLFLPEKCVHCEHPTTRSQKGRAKNALDKYLCAVCKRILEFQEQPGEEFLRDQLNLVASKHPLSKCRSNYWFNDASPVQSVIHSFKYSSMPQLAKHFGRILAPLVPSHAEVIIPVPLHRTRMAERGYNQARALAEGIGEARGGIVLDVLKRTRPTPSQTHLSISERAENMRGAFALTRHAEAVHGKHVVLIDDVMTTGSTLASAAEALFAAKPKSVSIVTLAAAPK